MWASIFILGFTVAAACYWMRQIVVTLLKQNDSPSAVQVAEANRLEFLRVREALSASYDAATAPALVEALTSDFRLLSYLLRYAATVDVGRYTPSERLLITDFYLMRATHAVVKDVWPDVARHSLLEMTAILEHFAGVMAHRMRLFSPSQS